MFFNDALDVHNEYSGAGGHPDILGDGYLCRFNPIYRRVKDQALKLGCEFVEAEPDYLLLPFLALPDIVKRRRVPYVPSARLMSQVERQHPGVFSTEDLPMAESYHLHEAAHVIAEDVLVAVTASSREERILKALLAESFANTVDALACLPVADDIHHFFIRQNCYMHPETSTVRALNEVAAKLGSRFLFHFVFRIYLQANFLAAPLKPKTVKDLLARYTDGQAIDLRLRKSLARVRAIGEKLDPRFRVTTTGNYFRQQGLTGDIVDLLDFPFAEMLARKTEVVAAIDALGVVLTSPMT